MKKEKKHLATGAIAPPCHGQMPAKKRGLWNRLPTVVKVILTAAGIFAMWAWLSGGPSVTV